MELGTYQTTFLAIKITWKSCYYIVISFNKVTIQHERSPLCPCFGRFLSPDPIVQAPDNSQSFNRYSYCLNNPMKYIDPSGLMVYYYDNKGHLLFTEDTGNCAMEKVFCGEGAVVFGKKRDAFGVNNYVPQNTNI